MTRQELKFARAGFGQRLRLLGRSAWRLIRYYAAGLYNKSDMDHVFLMAGGLAFSLVVCSIPLILIVFSLAGVVLDRPIIADEINSYIDRVIPYERFAENVKDIVFDRVKEFRLYKGVAGILGIVGLLAASSSVFGSMRTILNTVYRVREQRSVVISKLLDFALVLLALFYFLLSASFAPVVEILLHLAQQVQILNFLRVSTAGEIVIQSGSTLMVFTATVLMYVFVPERRTPLRVAVLSAIATAVLWSAAQYLFGVYIQHAVNLRRIYGAYLMVIAVVFWVYYSSLVFILGAEFGQLSSRRKALARVVDS